MIGKAIFWIGLLVLLTPHEPDLGLGRPSAAILESATVRQDYIAPHPMELIAEDLPHKLLSLREGLLRRAPQIRADIRDSLNRRKDASGPLEDGESNRRF